MSLRGRGSLTLTTTPAGHVHKLERYPKPEPQQAVGNVASVTVKGLPRRIAGGTRALVLGSMPGSLSLERRQYYAHPRNRFWPVMETLVGLDTSAPYAERVRQLLRAGIGLWDVIESCKRAGSLDASIVSGSEIPNDFTALLRRHTQIAVLAFNGSKAFKTFSRDVAPNLAALRQVDLLPLPSTSPANAAWTLTRLVNNWSGLVRYLGQG